jgi:transcriptional regulator with XRE-family HTH domain
MNGQDFQKKLKDLGITQAKVAEILGVTPQTVSGMMRTASVKIGMLEKIAQGIGKDISVFLEENDIQEKNRTLLKEKDEKIAELEATIQRLIGIIEKMQQ